MGGEKTHAPKNSNAAHLCTATKNRGMLQLCMREAEEERGAEMDNLTFQHLVGYCSCEAKVLMLCRERSQAKLRRVVGREFFASVLFQRPINPCANWTSHAHLSRAHAPAIPALLHGRQMPTATCRHQMQLEWPNGRRRQA